MISANRDWNITDLPTRFHSLGSEFEKMISLNTLVQIVSLEVQSFHNFLLYAAGFLIFFVSIGLIKKIARV